jgi:hypothetical protein
MKKNIITVLPYVFITTSTPMVKTQNKDPEKEVAVLKKNK